LTIHFGFNLQMNLKTVLVNPLCFSRIVVSKKSEA
jgi:hypothetical protein